MPKIFGKEVPTYMIGLMGVAAIALGYIALTPPEAPIASTGKKATPKSSDKKDQYQPADYTAKFAVYNEAPKDAFKPLIVRKSASTAPGPALGAPNNPFAPSADDTGGEGGWSFTGYVVLNGQENALLENSKTGDGSYVTEGEHWKKVTIGKITPNTVEFIGPKGRHTIKLGEVSEPKAPAGVLPGIAGVPPINPAPALRGTIGGVAANGANPANPAVPGTTPPGIAGAAVDPNAGFNDLGVQPDFGNRGGRRGRRGRQFGQGNQ